MPATKLFLYKARDANVVVILRRGNSRSLWEMIRWDIETDTFTRGQWLTVPAYMNGAYCAVSPDGQHFAYWYTEFEQPFTTHAVISEVPYFTALLYTKEHAGMWDTLAFNAQGQPMHSRAGRLVKRNPTKLKPAAWEKGVDSGYRADFMDFRGRHITTDKGRLLAGGQLLYDTTDHAFKQLKYVAGQELPTEKREEVWEHYTENGEPRARRIYFPAEMAAPAEPPRRSARLAAKATAC
jgi:hypothetical protein